MRAILKLFAIAFVVVCFASAANAQTQITQVEIRGNQRVETSSILLQITAKAGEKLDESAISNDVREIYRMGFFDQVEARVKGGVVIFDLKEKPALRSVSFEGNKEVDTDTLKEKISIDARRFLDRRKLAAGIDEAKAYYQSQGFYNTEITYRTESVGDNQVDVVFDVEEGAEKKLREIVFEGNAKIDSDDLEDEISTSDYNWWTSWLTGSGVVKPDMLTQDVQQLTRHYLNHGFVDVRIAEPSVTETEDGLRVTFKIEEGEVYAFDEITVSGDLIEENSEKTLEGVKSIAGETFSAEKLRQDSFSISEKFTDIGYAFANVDPQTDINRKDRKVRVVYNVSKGSLITVNRVVISGNKKTRDHVIRRSLKVSERELFSSSKIKRSESLLSRLGFFDEVTITPESTSSPDEVDLNVNVREGTTGTFSIGAGVSDGDGLIFSSRVSENNLFGYGHSLTLNVDTGTRNQNMVVSYDNPRVNDTYWSLGFDVLSVEREFDDFDRKQKGASTTVGYPLEFLGAEYLDDIRFFLRYEYLLVDISDIEEDAPILIKEAEGDSTSSSITPRLVRNTINNPLNPTEGSRQSLSVEVAGLGGNEEFWLGKASNTFYYPIVETFLGPIVFSNRLKYDYGKTYDDEETFPLFRRFFPGGINSVRGFDSRELGPKDEAGNEYGGSKEFVANFELIFPLFSAIGLKGLTFYDIGDAFDDNENIEFSELRQAFGWGIRWNSPLGPIRIELGYPIDKEPGEDSVVTHFSFGAPL